MFVVKDDDGKNDHKSYKSIYFNYFLICSNRVKLFLAMQVRVMAACMESQADILECTASAQSGRREVTVCFSPMSMGITQNWLQSNFRVTPLFSMRTVSPASSQSCCSVDA